jgi:hypothetical protein
MVLGTCPRPSAKLHKFHLIFIFSLQRCLQNVIVYLGRIPLGRAIRGSLVAHSCATALWAAPPIPCAWSVTARFIRYVADAKNRLAGRIRL